MNDHVGKPFDMEQLVAAWCAMPAGFAHVWPTAPRQTINPMRCCWPPHRLCLNMQAALDRLDGEADLYDQADGAVPARSPTTCDGRPQSLPWPSCRWR